MKISAEVENEQIKFKDVPYGSVFSWGAMNAHFVRCGLETAVRLGEECDSRYFDRDFHVTVAKEINIKY